MITSFAAWPKVLAGRVVFTAACPACGSEAVWEQLGLPTSDVYDIRCATCPPATGQDGGDAVVPLAEAVGAA